MSNVVHIKTNPIWLPLVRLLSVGLTHSSSPPINRFLVVYIKADFRKCGNVHDNKHNLWICISHEILKPLNYKPALPDIWPNLWYENLRAQSQSFNSKVLVHSIWKQTWGNADNVHDNKHNSCISHRIEASSVKACFLVHDCRQSRTTLHKLCSGGTLVSWAQE